MRETFTNAYNSIRSNIAIYADSAKRVAQFAWHLASSSTSSVWQFLSTNSQSVINRFRGVQSGATNTSAPASEPAQNTSTASYTYTQLTRPVNWMYERAQVNLPSFLRTQPAVSPVAANASAEPASQNRLN
jgi:hypothetical protein